MDARLRRVDHARVSRLRRQDLPELAKAMAAAMRGRAQVGPDTLNGMSYVRIKGVGVHAVVLSEDWDKILPRLSDGTFNPMPEPYAISEGEGSDSLQARILAVLETLFTESFPT